MRKKATINRLISIVLLLILVTASFSIIVSAVSINPSKPTGMYYTHNRTSNYSVGDAETLSRGMIHVVNISEYQPSIKWSGLVGNITGQLALLDEKNNALYDWSVTSTSGEIYATKEGPTGGGNIFGGGIPSWSNLTCATHTIIKNETFFLNHSGIDEDSLNKTFVPSFSLTSFFAGSKAINESVLGTPGGAGGYEVQGADSCAGLNLSDNSASSADFQEVILTDMTYQMPDDYASRQYDVIYAALIESDATGYNGSAYDFQMILPQSGLEGTQATITYYFYVELV